LIVSIESRITGRTKKWQSTLFHQGLILLTISPYNPVENNTVPRDEQKSYVTISHSPIDQNHIDSMR
jgi:hypothetical protein